MLSERPSIIELDHVVILTPNLDSLTGYWIRQGFTIEWGIQHGLERSNYVYFPDSSFIELRTTFSSNPRNPLRSRLLKFGTHISEVVFRTSDSLSAPPTTLPLRISLLHREAPQHCDISHPNGSYAIQWLVFAADKRTEQNLRSWLDGLSIPKHHEGCCDYWLTGDPDHRVALRFDKLYVSKPAGPSYLMLEDKQCIIGFN